ncbi:MAG: hypothetical protein GXX96_04720 [Planctomycetaceae bacterium]|nr:hypothetical protein [Planctomycetaceae bacterium]
MIATPTVSLEDRETTLLLNHTTSTHWCQICGQSVPRGVSVCYGCDVEVGVGDWPSRPRKLADRPITFRGFGRKRSRIRQ